MNLFASQSAHRPPSASLNRKLPILSFNLKTNHVAVSYADVAASGPRQPPAEAAAPQPPEIVSNDSTSTASLIDVDAPSVRTVNPDFFDQEVQTDTQSARLEREAAVEFEAKKAEAKKKARKADSWLTTQFSKLSDSGAGALALTNLAAVVGLSSFLGYKAWGLYDRGRLSWDNIGVGIGIIAGVGALQSVVGRYLYKTKGDKSS
ncbi:Alanine racemase, N-terminal domain [Geosmithia morbida]|uniref:Alanine racemase, N-terminal domain n=1 Tax=Geosmithia morbida TaxID=1094350 RepID=A0A9P5D3Z7_9HYPO|nr:Alanine racemase, N-terminal domain [Geosmithia morbida]KAF4125507.1 Alanine racemase, N-terminal domain [Geosmithia morbida]